MKDLKNKGKKEVKLFELCLTIDALPCKQQTIIGVRK